MSESWKDKWGEATAAEGWKDKWRRRKLWTKQQLALLCCGIDPDAAEIPWRRRDSSSKPGPESATVPDSPVTADWEYEKALNQINLALQVGLLRKAVDGPLAAHEVIWASMPPFKPRDVVQWASEEFADFPFQPSEFGFPEEYGDPELDKKTQGQKEGNYRRIIAALVASHPATKEVWTPPGDPKNSERNYKEIARRIKKLLDQLDMEKPSEKTIERALRSAERSLMSRPPRKPKDATSVTRIVPNQ